MSERIVRGGIGAWAALLSGSVLVTAGVGLAVHAGAQRELLAEQQAAVVDTQLADVGGPRAQPGTRVVMGEHFAVFPGAAVERAGVPSLLGDDLSPSDEVEVTWIPIVSPRSSFGRSLMEAAAASARSVAGDAGEAPEPDPAAVPYGRYPRAVALRVVARTERYGTVGDVPENLVVGDKLIGRVLEGPVPESVVEVLARTFAQTRADTVVAIEPAPVPLERLTTARYKAWSQILLVLGAPLLLFGVVRIGMGSKPEGPRKPRHVLPPHLR